MKSSLLYLSFLLFLLSCNTVPESIEKTWISKYGVYYEGEKNEHISSSNLKCLLYFDGDSLTFY